MSCCNSYLEELLQVPNAKRTDTCSVCNVVVAMHARSPSGPAAYPTSTSSSNVVRALSQLDLPKWSSKSVAHTFIQRIDILLGVTTLPEEDYSKALLMVFDNINQLEWIKSNITSKNLSWSDAQSKFIEHFARADYSLQLTDDFSELKQGSSSAQEYADKFLSLADQLGYTDDGDHRNINHFVKGLSNELFKAYRSLLVPMRVKGESIDSLSEAIQMAIELDVASADSRRRGDDGRHGRGITSSTSNKTSSNQHGSSRKTCFYHPGSSSHTTAECSQNPKNKPGTPSTVTTFTKTDTFVKKDGTKVKCHECGGPHYRPDCPNLQKDDNQSVKPEQRRSGRDSHPPERFNPAAKAVQVTGSTDTLTVTSHPLPAVCFEDTTKSIFFVLAGQAYKVLLDTGAGSSFMDHGLVKSLNLNIVPSPGVIQLAQKDTVMDRIGTTDSLPICISVRSQQCSCS